MPIYEYYCPECETTFEKRQSFNAAPVAGCNDCGYTGAKRKISAPAIVFKGSGFYVNDSRNGSDKKNGHKNGSTNGKSSETSTETKTETKAESTTKPSTTKETATSS